MKKIINTKGWSLFLLLASFTISSADGVYETFDFRTIGDVTQIGDIGASHMDNSTILAVVDGSSTPADPFGGARNKSLRLADFDEVDNGAYAQWNAGVPQISGVVSLDFYVKDHDEGILYISLYQAGIARIQTRAFNGAFQFWDGSVYTTADNCCAEDQAHTLSITFDADSDIWSAMLDSQVVTSGDGVVSNFSFFNTSPVGVQYVRAWSTGGSIWQADAFVDNIKLLPKPPAQKMRGVLDRIWGNRKQYFIDWINNGFATPGSIDINSIYNVQLFTANLLTYAADVRDIYLLDGLSEVYLEAYDDLTYANEYVYTYWPNDWKYSVHELETPARMWLGNPPDRASNSPFYGNMLGQENVLTSGQFLYGVANLIRSIMDLPVAQRTVNMTRLVENYVPVILTDHYDRWIFAGQGIFQRKGWGASVGLYNHLENLGRLLNREYNGSASYMNVVTDRDMWIIAGVTEMLAAHAKDPVRVPMTDQAERNLLDYVELGAELIEDRMTTNSLINFQGQGVAGINFDLGEWDDHSGYDYAGYTNEAPAPEPEWTEIPPVNIGWDISHARRFVNVFETLHKNRAFTGLTFPDQSVMEGLAAQLIYGSFNKNLDEPLFSNFMDGQNGWYRVGYHDGFPGYEPYGMCTAFTTGGYGFWAEFNSDIATVRDLLWDKISAFYAKDLSGNNRDCFVENGQWQAGSGNGSSGSMIFSGTADSFLDGGSYPAYASSQGTIEFWVKPAQSSATEGIVKISGDNSDDYLLVRHNANNTIRLQIRDSFVVMMDLYTTGTVPVGEWSHLALTQNGTTAKIYINGVEATTTGVNSGTWTDHIPIVDAWFGKGLSYTIDGSMDDVRVYDRALTAAEIVQDMAGQAPALNNMVSRWEFDDPPNQTDIDFIADYYDADYDLSDSLNLLMFLPVLLNDTPPSSGLFFMLK